MPSPPGFRPKLATRSFLIAIPSLLLIAGVAGAQGHPGNEQQIALAFEEQALVAGGWWPAA
jgi:hypothetical protein